MKITKVIVLLSGITFNSAAHAYTCIGKIDNFQITSRGLVQITANEIYQSGTGRAICSVSNSWKGVTSEACKTWVAILLSAEAAPARIYVQYTDSFSCKTQPTWSNASAPFMIKK